MAAAPPTSSLSAFFTTHVVRTLSIASVTTLVICVLVSLTLSLTTGHVMSAVVVVTFGCVMSPFVVYTSGPDMLELVVLAPMGLGRSATKLETDVDVSLQCRVLHSGDFVYRRRLRSGEVVRVFARRMVNFSAVQRGFHDGLGKSVVVLVHGTGGHSGEKELAELSFELVNGLGGQRRAVVVAIDLEGHGRSGGTHGYLPDIEEAAYDVLTFMARAKRLVSAGDSQKKLPTFIVGAGGIGSLVALTARRLLVTNAATSTITNTSALDGVIVLNPPLADVCENDAIFSRGAGLRGTSWARFAFMFVRAHMPKMPLFANLIPCHGKTPLRSRAKVVDIDEYQCGTEPEAQRRRSEKKDPLRYDGPVRVGTAAAATAATEAIVASMRRDAAAAKADKTALGHRRPVPVLIQLDRSAPVSLETLASDGVTMWRYDCASVIDDARARADCAEWMDHMR